MIPSGLERQLEVASLSGEVEAVMAGILKRLMELEDADGASLSTVDDAHAYFVVCAGEDAALAGKTFALGDTLGAECVASCELVVLRATDASDVNGCLTPGASAILLAPIDYDGLTRGVLGVRSANPAAFTPSEVEAVRLLARGASVALRNAEVVERLAESERRYRELYAQGADATLVSDLEGNLLDANAAASAMLWYSVDELRTMHASALIAPGELELASTRKAQLNATRELRSERRFRRKDGALIDVEYSARVLDDGRVHTSLRDVTQRKRNEDRLRHSLSRLHAIVETQQEISKLELDPDAVTSAIVERAQRLAGGDGAAVQWFDGTDSVFHHASGTAATQIGLRLDRNASLAGVAGLQREALYAADTETDPRVDTDACRRLQARSLICAPLFRDARIEGVLSVMARKPEAFDELAVETTRLMAEFVSTVIRNANELETRRRLVAELRTQGQVVEHMQTALWVWEPAGETYRLTQANLASERATGVPVQEVIGSMLEEVLPATTGQLRSIFGQVVESGEQVDAGEVEYGDERIEPGMFWVKAFPLPGGRIAMTFDNVTEMARARRALQESEERFRGAFNASSVGMTLTQLDGTLVQVNDRFAAMVGYTSPPWSATRPMSSWG